MATSTVKPSDDLVSQNSNGIERQSDGSRKHKTNSFPNDGQTPKESFSAEGEPRGTHQQTSISKTANDERLLYSINQCLRDFCRHRLYVHCILWRDKHVKALRVRFRKLELEKAEESANSKIVIRAKMKFAIESIRSLDANVQRSGIDSLLELQGLVKMP